MEERRLPKPPKVRAMRIVTRLERLRRTRKIKPTVLSREANVSRQHLTEIRAARREPRRPIIAKIVSAFRHLTLEPIQAEDVFELSNEESGVWRTRAVILDGRGAANESARKLVRQLLQIDLAQWPQAVANGRAELDDAALARTLILEAKQAVDTSPAVATALARLATEIAPQAEDAQPGYRDHLEGCAWLEYANGLRHLGKYDAAIECLARAEELLSGRTISATELAETWYVGAAVEWKRSNFSQALLLCHRAERMLDVLGDQRRVVHAEILEAGIHFERGDAAHAKDLWARAVEPLLELRDRRTLAAVWMNLGTAEGYLGNTDAARGWLEKAFREFSRLRVEPEMARAAWSLGYILGMHGARARGLLLLRESRRVFERLRMDADAGFAGLDLAEVLLLSADGAVEAADVCQAILKIFERARLAQAKLKAVAFLCEALRSRRARPALVAYVRSYVEAHDDHPDVSFAPPDIPQ
jgi:tetratricopeptide (TPR) repeat protein